MILVDELRITEHSPKWKYNESCHLFHSENNLEELHSFAMKLGLKKDWFHNHKSIPHYDLTKRKRIKAIKLGAVEMNIKKFIKTKKEKQDGNERSKK